MKKWAMLLVVLALCSLAFAQVPPARACKIPVYNTFCGCWFVGLTSGSGYCTFKITQPCNTCGGGGASQLAFYGTCTPPTYCAAPLTKTQLTKRLSLPRNRWVGLIKLPSTIGVTSMQTALALQSVQEQLTAKDVNDCAWHSIYMVMTNKANPEKPWIMDFRDTGNAYVMTLVKHATEPILDDPESRLKVSDHEIGEKWTLILSEGSWSLESTAGDHTSGEF